MSDESQNVQDSPAEPNNKSQINSCPDCKKDPCVCLDKGDKVRSETLNEDSKNNGNLAKAKPPKISWI